VPKTIVNKFTKFEFVDKEFFSATRFTEINLMLIQTLAATAAESLADLKLDMTEEGINKEQAVILFAQRQAELIGEMKAYEHLILLFQNTTDPVEQKPAGPIVLTANFLATQPKGT
jgi:hypothetical protein